LRRSGEQSRADRLDPSGLSGGPGIPILVPGPRPPGEVSGHASGSRVTGRIVQFLHGKPNKRCTETFTATRG
jgi:hypothetical protein